MKQAKGCEIIGPSGKPGAWRGKRVVTPDGVYCLDPEDEHATDIGDVVTVDYHPEDQFASLAREDD